VSPDRGEIVSSLIAHSATDRNVAPAAQIIPQTRLAVERPGGEAANESTTGSRGQFPVRAARPQAP